jgi:hypothetical protein
MLLHHAFLHSQQICDDKKVRRVVPNSIMTCVRPFLSESDKCDLLVVTGAFCVDFFDGVPIATVTGSVNISCSLRCTSPRLVVADRSYLHSKRATGLLIHMPSSSPSSSSSQTSALQDVAAIYACSAGIGGRQAAVLHVVKLLGCGIAAMTFGGRMVPLFRGRHHFFTCLPSVHI